MNFGKMCHTGTEPHNRNDTRFHLESVYLCQGITAMWFRFFFFFFNKIKPVWKLLYWNQICTKSSSCKYIVQWYCRHNVLGLDSYMLKIGQTHSMLLIQHHPSYAQCKWHHKCDLYSSIYFNLQDPDQYLDLDNPDQYLELS